MLGLADRARVFDLFEAVMRGDIRAALEELRDQYDVGADPAVVLQDMLELTHWVTRVKLVPEAGGDVTVSETERGHGREMAAALSMPVLARTWQMLLKGLGETRAAPSPLAAAEMVLVRLAYVADLPSPADVVRQVRAERSEGGGSGRSPGAAAALPGAGPVSTEMPGMPAMPRVGAEPGHDPVGGSPQAALARRAEPEAVPEPAPMSAPAPVPVPEVGPGPQPDAPGLRDRPASEVPGLRDRPAPEVPEGPGGARLESFRAVVDYVAARGEPVLAASLALNVHPVRFSPGRIEIRLGEGAERRLPSRLGELLTQWTGERWMVMVSDESGEATLKAQEDADRAARLAAVEAHPLVRAVREAFPGARITGMRDHAAEPAPSEGEVAGDDQELSDGDRQA